jgi:putative FmdB family regulatory protein
MRGYGGADVRCNKPFHQPSTEGRNQFMIYTFQCRKCNERFDVNESLAEHDRGQEKCPKCGSKALDRRVVGGVQVKTSRKS